MDNNDNVAWTPGPWRWHEDRRDRNFTTGVIVAESDDTLVLGAEGDAESTWGFPADVSLIALAPDMAEAILAWQSNRLQRCECEEDYDRVTYVCPSCKSIESVLDVANKLRAITDRKATA